MAKRIFDIIFSLIAIVIFAPFVILGMIGIMLSSRGPVIYRATRVGKDGKLFTMFKLRTMHVDHGAINSAITSVEDSRVFRVGKILRYAKIDEMPQFLNILGGSMSVVGPRPEDPSFVNEYYTKAQMETLKVRPGLTSPGSIYYYTHIHKLISDENPEKDYIEKVLGMKLAVDMVYLRESSFFYDLSIIFKTLITVFQIVNGKSEFPDPPELAKALKTGFR